MAIFRHRAKPSRTQEKNDQGDFYSSLVTIQDPYGAASEAYRMLRTNILYPFTDAPPKTIVVTSADIGEGKTTVCGNLGVALAQAGKSTLIADCDFRKPAMHKLFELRNIIGIMDVLVGERSIQEVYEEPVAGLQVATMGPIPPNPAEILGSQRFSGFLTSIREEFDYILIDTPPVGRVTDPAILATQGDGVILVVNAQNTHKDDVRRSVRSLQAVGAHVLGTVMNNVKVSRREYEYYSYSGKTSS
jgi:capsular exopolysaccharide synthesis family protein